MLCDQKSPLQPFVEYCLCLFFLATGKDSRKGDETIPKDDFFYSFCHHGTDFFFLIIGIILTGKYSQRICTDEQCCLLF